MKNGRFFWKWRKIASGTIAFLMLFPIFSPYAYASVVDGAPENVLSGPNNGYVSLLNSGSYAPAFALSGTLDTGNDVFVNVLSGATVVATGSLVSASGGESSGSVSAIDFTSLADGPYSLSGSVFSWATVTASGITGSIVKDTVNPVFASTGTVSAGTGSATFTGISVTDANFASAALSYSGIVNSLQTGTFSLTWSSSNLGVTIVGLNSGATYAYSLSALDLAGNSATVSAGTFATVTGSPDTTPPVVTVSSHTNGQNVTGSTAFLTGSATDSGTVVSVTVNASPATVSGQTWSKTVSGLVAGSNAFTVIATDNAGNTGTGTVNLIRVPAAPIDQSAVITGLAQADVSFSTDVSATGTVLYGTNSGSLNLSASDVGPVTSHTVPLTGLASDTVYFYKVFGTSLGNSGALSSLSSFKTSSVIDVTTASGAVSASWAAFFSGSTATGATFTNSGTLVITSLNGTDSVSFPFGGLTLLSSGSWDSLFQAPTPTSNTATWAAPGFVFVGSTYQIGSSASELSLTGSFTGTVSVRVGTQFSGQTVKAYRSTDGVNYAFLANCTVSGAGDCVFQSTQFSLFAFAAVTDTVPNAFAFASASNAELSTLTTSAPITVSGINAPAVISVAGGEYNVNGGAFVTSSWTVNNGDTVSVRLVSSSAFSTASTATVTIGGVSGSFQVTTKAPTTTNVPGTTFTGGGGGGSGIGGGSSTVTPVVPVVPGGSPVGPGGTNPAGVPPSIIMNVDDLIFVDIANNWARTYIEKLAIRGIVNNVTLFHPDYALTRAEFLKIVGNSVGWQLGTSETSYADVPADSWFAPYVAYAYSNGIIMANANFRPNDTITRAEVAKVLIGMLRRSPSTTNTSSFADVSRTHTLFSYIEAVREIGVFDGQVVNGQRIFRPNDPISRAEVAKVVVRSLGF